MRNKTLLLVIAFILLVSSVSAFGEVASSSSSTSSKVIVRDWYNVPILSSNVADMQLLVPHVNYVPIGVDVKVAEFNITSLRDYTNALSDIQFYNAKDGTQIVKNFTYKILEHPIATRDTFATSCSLINQSIQECRQVKNGTEEYQTDSWQVLNDSDLSLGNYTIGVFTQVKPNDYVEWIPTLFGARISQWAIYAADPQLVAYWNFDEGGGSIAKDVVRQQYNFTVIKTAAWNLTNFKGGTSAISNNGTVSGRPFYTFLNITPYERTTGVTISGWVYLNANVSNSEICWIGYNQAASQGNFCVGVGMNGAGTWGTGIRDGVSGYVSSYATPIQANQIKNWTFYLITLNLTGGSAYLDLWLNGIKMNSTIGTNGLGIVDGNLAVLAMRPDEYGAFNGSVDEVGIWNRTMNSTDIATLYRTGLGLFYPFTNLQVNLINPANNLFTNNDTQLFQYNVSTIGTNAFSNVTLNIWNASGQVVAQNTTTLSGISPIQANMTVYLGNGTYTWNAQAFDNSNAYVWAANNRTVYIDTTPTSVRFVPPSDTNNSNLTRSNIIGNVSATTFNPFDFANTTITVYNLTYSLVFINTSASSPYFVNITNLPDGSYYINATAMSKYGSINNSETRNISIDTTAPIVNIIAPLNGSYIYPTNQTFINFTLNINQSDLNRGSCYYNTSYNPAISIIPCGTNQQINLTNIFGKQSIFAFANDSVGYISMNQSIIEIPQVSYNSNTTTLSLETFTLNISYFNGHAPQQVNLIYNGTNYPVGFSLDSGGNYIESVKITIPSSSGIKYFYWNNILDDNSITNSSMYNQSVSALTLDNCGTNTYQILNYTLRDEDTMNLIVPNGNNTNTTLDINVIISAISNPSIFINYSASKSNTNPVSICIPSGLTGTSQYRLDAQVGYTSTNHVYEYNNIQNYTLQQTNQSWNVTLYNLLTSRATAYSIVFKDSSFLPITNALIQIMRPFDGNYQVVQSPITDVDGKVTAYLISNDIQYAVVVSQDGNLINAFSNVIAQCLTPQVAACVINLQNYGQGISPINLLQNNNLVFNVSWDGVGKVASIFFSTLSGATSTFNFTVTSVNQSQTLCSQSVVTSSGSMSCSIPLSYGNNTILTQFYKDGNFVYQQFINIKPSAQSIYGSTRILLAVGLILILIGMGISSGAFPTLILLIIGVILAGALNLVDSFSLFGIGSSLVWLIVSIIIVLIKYQMKGR